MPDRSDIRNLPLGDTLPAGFKMTAPDGSRSQKQGQPDALRHRLLLGEGRMNSWLVWWKGWRAARLSGAVTSAAQLAAGGKCQPWQLGSAVIARAALTVGSSSHRVPARYPEAAITRRGAGQQVST
jgi:hypothetical protein